MKYNDPVQYNEYGHDVIIYTTWVKLYLDDWSIVSYIFKY